MGFQSLVECRQRESPVGDMMGGITRAKQLTDPCS